jgi:hypothetical protein
MQDSTQVAALSLIAVSVTGSPPVRDELVRDVIPAVMLARITHFAWPNLAWP